ncbi:unnamed protein product [Notodromas monacha]|uniref:PITH domain-containing protein n=1 Tax=Notodromas monacha TaxID=399045 RepID=A0A7R9BKL7_9CRUS|nr:unnamed protein product [Notodromas monacha]CAG0916963.1 unnamed protein product [Notodromas monacha]
MENFLTKFSVRSSDSKWNIGICDEAEFTCVSCVYVGKFCPIQGINPLVALGHDSGVVTVCNTSSSLHEEPKWRFKQSECGSHSIFDLDWSTCKPMIVIGTANKTCRILRIRPSEVVVGEVFQKHERTVKCVKWLPDSDTVFASGGRDSTVIVWDLRVKSKTSSVIRLPRISPLGSKRTKITASDTNERHTSVQGIQFVDSNHMITANDGDGCIRVWDLRRAYSESWTRPSVPLHVLPLPGAADGRHSAVSLALDKFRSTLYASCTDKSVYAYDVINFNRNPLRKFSGHEGKFDHPLCISCDGSYMVAQSGADEIVFWDLKSSSCLPTAKLELDGVGVTCLDCHAVDPGDIFIGSMTHHFVARLCDPVHSPKEEVITKFQAVEINPNPGNLDRRKRAWKDMTMQKVYGLGRRFEIYNHCPRPISNLSSTSKVIPYLPKVDISEDKENIMFVESDVDEELLFNIPFTGSVKMKGIILMGPDEESHPSKIRLFKNRPKMTFDAASGAPDQEISLSKDPKGVIEYPLKPTKFSDVTYLSIHIPGNYGTDKTRVDYIGLAGEWRPAHRHGVTICNYELAPSVADHPEVDDWNKVGGNHVM